MQTMTKKFFSISPVIIYFRFPYYDDKGVPLIET